MEVVMAENVNQRRRPWEAKDNEVLMALWDTIGSVFIIAKIMNRSASSIQTQASRLGLPPRGADLDKARRKWMEEDDELLERLEFEKVTDEGLLDIMAISKEMGRSPDQVIARLESLRPDEDWLSKILIPSSSQFLCEEVNDAAKKNTGQRSKCLKCRKPFRSEGKHNWVCVRCKRGEDWLSA
jgi:hypothetical protein